MEPRLSPELSDGDVFRSIGCRYYANIIPGVALKQPSSHPGFLRRPVGWEDAWEARVMHTRSMCVLRNSCTCSPPSFQSHPSGRNLWGLRAPRGRRTRRKRDFSGAGARAKAPRTDRILRRVFTEGFRSRSRFPIFWTEWIGWRAAESIVLHSLRILRVRSLNSYSLVYP